MLKIENLVQKVALRLLVRLTPRRQKPRESRLSGSCASFVVVLMDTDDSLFLCFRQFLKCQAFLSCLTFWTKKMRYSPPTYGHGCHGFF
ncbi:hypothetical protein [Desulfatiglans anilini]|uniref:hypothetical protein n=1 Tax=Desulfatiglans anilini TaxID=90728 RepID=UPI0012947E2D|nr:hypothetical protein [Desulfatiglans anilini]